MLEEYDFRNDTVNANLDIDLKPATVIRPYQETSLSKMFGNGCATIPQLIVVKLIRVNQSCAFRDHCVTLRCREDVGRDNCSLHHQKIVSGVVHFLVS